MLTICHVIIAALAEFWGEYWNCKRFVWIFGKVFMHHLLDSCIQLRSFHSFFLKFCTVNLLASLPIGKIAFVLAVD